MRVQRERRSMLRVMLSTVACGAMLAGTGRVTFAQDSRPATTTTRPSTMSTTRVAFKFSNAQVVSVLDKLSTDYGFQIAQNEAGPDTRIDVISAPALSADEALTLINASLKSKEFVIVRMGPILKLLTKSHAKEAPPVYYGVDLDTIPETDDLRTQVMPVGALDAVRLRQDLTPIISSGTNIMANAASNTLVVTDSSNAVRRIATIINSMNQKTSEEADLRVI